MKLVKLTDEITHVMPSEITEVTASYDSKVITVRMKSGIGYKVQPEYKQTLGDRYKLLVAEINEALK